MNKDIKKWFIVLIFVVAFVGWELIRNYNKQKLSKESVTAYIITSSENGYIYKSNTWSKTNDLSFIKEKEFKVYSGQSYYGLMRADIIDNLLCFSDNTQTYYNQIGINSNMDVNSYKIKYEELNEQDINNVKEYLIGKKIFYDDFNTKIKVIITDMNGDLIKERVYIVENSTSNNYYSLMFIKYNDNLSEDIFYIYEKGAAEEEQIQMKLIMITDIDQNGKKELFVRKSFYETFEVKLYVNQQGMYQSIE